MLSLGHRSPRGQAVRARERSPEPLLPYARHLTDQVIALDSGALMMTFRLEGASFETADARDLNDWHARLNNAWRNLASERLALWHHLIRRRAEVYPQGRFTSDFAKELDEAYRARITGRRMFLNALYVSLVLHPGLGRSAQAVGAASAAFGRLGRLSSAAPHQDEDERTRTLEEAGRELVQHLARYGPQPLGLKAQGGLLLSEPMGFLAEILTGRPRPAPLVRGHLGSALYTARVIFGREALEVRGACETRFGGLFGIKEYPASTRPGVWNSLLSAPFPFVATQSFAFLSKPAARAVMERKQNQFASARDPAASQIRGLAEGLDDLISNRFVMGEHHASLLVWGETPSALSQHMAEARALLADSGLVAAREDLALEAGFWAQFPGGFRHRVRPAAISSRNFAGLAPFHTHPTGKAEDNHWGQAVALLRTTAGSPFYFNFHVGDLGHTFICGPSGSGKTVVQNFMLAQLEKFAAQQVFIDKDRGSEIFIRARGGTYLSLKTGKPTGFAPLRALEFTPANRAFLGALLRQILKVGDQTLRPDETLAIDRAIAALAPLDPKKRSFAALRTLLGQGDAGGLGARLEPWTRDGPLGWALDGDDDALSLQPQLIGLDMTEVLDQAEVRAPIMMYLFHRLSALVDGRRLVLDIDEFWKTLSDEAFRSLAQDGLKTWRKQNAFMVFATQSPADVLRSPIAHTVVEQCATKIFLPNRNATAADYIAGFGLSRREFELVRVGMDPMLGQFLVKQGLNSLVVQLDLGGLDEALAILSGRSETVELLDRLRQTCGETYADWRAAFHQHRRDRP